MNRTVSLILLTAAVIGALGIIWKVVVRGRSTWRSAHAVFTKIVDTLVGREAVVDTITGEEKLPALPGIGVRMAHQEQQMELLAITVTKLVDQQVHQTQLAQRVDEHDDRLRVLEAAQVERVITRAESAQAWQAMEAAINSTPPPIDEAE